MSFQSILKKYSKQNDYHKVDLSAKTLEEKSIDASNHVALNHYLKQIKSINQAKVLYGGYLEKRSLYKQKDLFKSHNKQRNIHIGVDFWTDAGEEIVAPLDGVIHSFKDNKGIGNYGSCIILKHLENNKIFYTLYGHLSRESLSGLNIGQNIKRNQGFCKLGKTDENGGYLPHLHFQIINNIDDYFGDYPGVCHEDDLDFYKNNTSDPNLFLGL